jgi:hypothetical protein
MMVMRATGDIRKVSLWLGHAAIQTTEIYLCADPREKLKAMSAVVPLSRNSLIRSTAFFQVLCWSTAKTSRAEIAALRGPVLDRFLITSDLTRD